MFDVRDQIREAGPTLAAALIEGDGDRANTLRALGPDCAEYGE